MARLAHHEISHDMGDPLNCDKVHRSVVGRRPRRCRFQCRQCGNPLRRICSIVASRSTPQNIQIPVKGKVFSVFHQIQTLSVTIAVVTVNRVITTIRVIRVKRVVSVIRFIRDIGVIRVIRVKKVSRISRVIRFIRVITSDPARVR